MKRWTSALLGLGLVMAAAAAGQPALAAQELQATLHWARRVELGMPVSGVVQEVSVARGQHVAAGQALVTLDPRDFEARLAGASARLAGVVPALEEARQAAEVGEVPVGAVVVRGGLVIVRAHNTREIDKDPTAHAEMLALREAAQLLRDWRLTGCTLYVTLEPCPMCAGALVNSRVSRVVYGCDDPKAGAVRSLYEIGSDPRLNHRFEVTAGVMGASCSAQLTEFFEAIRQRRRQEKG